MKDIVDNNGTAYGPIPKDWAERTNLEPGKTAKIILAKNRYGQMEIRIRNNEIAKELKEEASDDHQR